ncbi:DUF202 domain-containing protein [Streptomyces sp. NPDC047028]|uniref:YidH family protein n=1 Tax=Streptomyces sp. NPDC047028 TaxID=3155793 RepID=UPI0033F0A16D
MSGITLGAATGAGHRAADTPPETGTGTDHGTEPDYRFSLANERTALAWFRTALALLAGCVGLFQFSPEGAVPALRTALSTLLAALSMAASTGGMLRWRQVQAAMRRGGPLPPSGALLLLIQATGLIAVALAVVLLTVTA